MNAQKLIASYIALNGDATIDSPLATLILLSSKMLPAER